MDLPPASVDLLSSTGSRLLPTYKFCEDGKSPLHTSHLEDPSAVTSKQRSLVQSRCQRFVLASTQRKIVSLKLLPSGGSGGEVELLAVEAAAGGGLGSGEAAAGGGLGSASDSGSCVCV